MYIECLNALCDDFLIRNDKLGMHFSMKSRFTLMCNELRDYVRSIPSKLKAEMSAVVKNGVTTNKFKFKAKTLFKNAYDGRLPEYIVRKKKTGWRFTTDEILVGSEKHGQDDSVLRQYIIETLKDKEVREIFELDDDIIWSFMDNRNFTAKTE